MRGRQASVERWLPHGLAALDSEAEIQEELAEADDFREGVQAFLERRPAALGGA